MKNEFTQTRFALEITKDGSPTLRLPDGESMHHSGGAAAETVYIYKSVISEALRLKPGAHTCVVGLGMGYIEISWAQCGPEASATLTSFEIEEELRSAFQSWVESAEPGIYDGISALLDPSAQIGAVKRHLSAVQIFSDIRSFGGPASPWNVVCYDAFSRKTNEELWSAGFLSEFLKKFCGDDCVFTTYGCTGVLKKALRENDFMVIQRPSFNGKRDSTLALRGVFKEYSQNFFRTF